ncbi:MAG TPA: nuclear transport factor 2 family protein [Nitrolancea sp.]|nr:nuclear transport factor 2 family protein [Nitrolancea sp.]
MSDENVDLIRNGYAAYIRGDMRLLLELVDPDLEWTYLDPGFEDPEPQVCHGRHELETALKRQARRNLKSEIEEVISQGDRVMLVVHTPGIEKHRNRHGDERNYDVFTVRDGRIVALRACRNREEALSITGIQSGSERA